MAIEVKHKFKSEMADGPNEELVQPSHWNDTHEIEVSGESVVGRPDAGDGAATSIPLSKYDEAPEEGQIARFSTSGRFRVGDPVEPHDAVHKEYADQFLPKVGAELDQTLVLSSPNRVPPFRLTPQAGFDAVENGDIWTTNAGVLAARLNGANRNMWHNGNLTSPSKEEAEQGTATIYRVWTAVNVATAIAAQLVKNLFSSEDKELPEDDDVFTGVEEDGVTGFKTTWGNIKAALTNFFLPLSGGTVNGPVAATRLIPSEGFGTNFIGEGTGDGASYTIYNMSIRSHYGIGMTTYNGDVNGFYNSRTGTWDVKGGYHVNGNPVVLSDWITYVGLIADDPSRPYIRRRTDNSIVDLQTRLGFTPIQQGGGVGQGGNKIRIGWGAGSRLLLQVDDHNAGNTWPININGTANVNRGQVMDHIAQSTPNTVGGYNFLRASSSLNAGATIAGSSLTYSDSGGSGGHLVGSGSWRCMGQTMGAGATLFLRYA